MVASLREARDRGALKAQPVFSRLTSTGVAWPDGTSIDADAIIWCTGLPPCGASSASARTSRSRWSGTCRRTHRHPCRGPAKAVLIGYADWTGLASATLLGVGRSACDTTAEITALLQG